MSSNRKIEKH